MNSDARYFIWKHLPGKLKAVYQVYLRGMICEYSHKDNFFHDYNMINQLNVESFSQAGQDAFIYHMVFGGKSDGFFLDIGGNDPVKINNTYLLEQKGWKGMAFEPVKALADKWKDVRKTPCYNMAIGRDEGEVDFTEAKENEHSGVGVEGDLTYKVKQRRVSNILKENSITHIDVVFIDVEGYEMSVLQGIDFENVDITCFCIENDRNGAMLPDDELRKFVVGKGYRLIGRLHYDDVFVKEDYFVKTKNV